MILGAAIGTIVIWIIFTLALPKENRLSIKPDDFVD
jgi:hypothetical protein